MIVMYVIKQIRQAALILGGFFIVLFGVGSTSEDTLTEDFGIARADAPSCTSCGESCTSCESGSDSACGCAGDCGGCAGGDCGGGCDGGCY